MGRLSEERKEVLLRRYGSISAAAGPGGMGPGGQEGRAVSADPGQDLRSTRRHLETNTLATINHCLLISVGIG